MVVPVFLFIVLNMPKVILSIMYNVGWGAMLGWAIFYTLFLNIEKVFKKVFLVDCS